MAWSSLQGRDPSPKFAAIGLPGDQADPRRVRRLVDSVGRTNIAPRPHLKRHHPLTTISRIGNREFHVKAAAFVRLITVPAAMFLLTSAFGASRADINQVMSRDGLSKISVRGLDLAYARPGVTLAKYNRIQLDVVDVVFHKSWEPTMKRSRVELSDEDREDIRTGVAKIVSEEFARAMQNDGIYQIVNGAGPDVLRVKINIVDLYIAAPQKGTDLRQTYTVTAGEMSIAAELFDSQTNEALARVVDRREARRTPNLVLTK